MPVPAPYNPGNAENTRTRRPASRKKHGAAYTLLTHAFAYDKIKLRFTSGKKVYIKGLICLTKYRYSLRQAVIPYCVKNLLPANNNVRFILIN